TSGPEGGALDITRAGRIQIRSRVLASDKRIVGRHRADRADTQHLAVGVGEVLRLTVRDDAGARGRARGDEERPIAAEAQTTIEDTVDEVRQLFEPCVILRETSTRHVTGADVDTAPFGRL